MQSRRSLERKVEELKLVNAEFYRQHSRLKNNINQLEWEVHDAKLIASQLNTAVCNDIANSFKISTLETDNALLNSKVKHLESNDWHEKYQKVLAKLEKIVNKNKEAF